MRILAALSGGVDSAVAAALLVREGHEVVAAHLATGVESDGGGAGGARSCCGADDARDARAVAAALGLPFYVVDVRAAFAREVLEPFTRTYAAGATPNPCVACNRGVKFGRLAEIAASLGAEAVATGHYARGEQGAGGRRRLLRARDARKDQTYVLHALSQEQLARARFPLADLTKDEVRDEARRMGLAVAEKRDSQELCFLPDGDVRGWLARQAPGAAVPGTYVDAAGRELGRHAGALGLTRGQRRGLPALGTPRYVESVEPTTGRVVLAERAALDDSGAEVAGLNWVDEAEPAPGTRWEVSVQVRHAAAPVAALLTVTGAGTAQVRFAQPVFAVAPGQALVAWRGAAVLCGGPIVRPCPRPVVGALASAEAGADGGGAGGASAEAGASTEAGAGA